MVFELDNWPRNLSNSLAIKNVCLVQLNQQEPEIKERKFTMVIELHFVELNYKVSVIILHKTLILGVNNSSSKKI